MTRAVVIRTYGDPNIALPVADTLSNSMEKIDKEELRRLRAELGVRNYARKIDYERKLEDLKGKYNIKPPTGLHAFCLVVVGFIILLSEDIKNGKKNAQRKHS